MLPAPTRACSICRRLPRSDSWTYAGGAPAAIDELVAVPVQRTRHADYESWRLLRCPQCAACYVETSHGEVDVNSIQTWGSFDRLTLGQLQRDEGPGFVPDWTAALRADLDHADPHWRTEAAHDLARDYVDAVRFDRVENELLRHAHAEVVRAALLLLVAERDAPVSTAALEAATGSLDEETRALATRMLVVRRGPEALEGLEVRSRAELEAVDTLLAHGAAPGPRLAARVLDFALTTTTEANVVVALVAKTAFAPAHLQATRGRLRAALDEPATRRRALALCVELAERALLDDATRTAALERGARSESAVDRRAALDVALAEMARTQLPDVAVDTLLCGSEEDTVVVVQHLSAAHERREDVGWAVPALATNVLRFRQGSDAALLLWQLAKSGVDVTPAVPALSEALGVTIAYAGRAAARALAHHFSRRADVDRVLALLSHAQPYVRAAAAAALADMRVPQPDRILDRLREMTTEKSQGPRDEATRALRWIPGAQG